MKTTRLPLILALLASVITSCHPKQSTSGFETLSESEKNHQWLLSRGYKVSTPQEYLADADSSLSVERSAGNYLSMSLAHWYMGNTRSSLAYADSALALAGDDAELNTRIQYRRASAYGTLGDREKERAAYKAIIDWGIDKDVRSAMESIALSYYVEGKYKEALAAMPDSLSKEGETCYRLIKEYLGLDPQDSDFILVKHLWKPLLVARFIVPAYSETEAVSWARGFQKANQRDTVWREELNVYGNVRRFMAVNDFYEAWHGEYRCFHKNNNRQTEWRLLQYDTTAAIPGSVCDKILHLKEVYEDILNYDTDIVDEMTRKVWLALDFRYYYVSTLYDVIYSSVNAKAREALRREQALAERYHDIMSDTYTKIDGQPDGMNGSSYPYRCGVFGMQDYDMEIDALELFMRFLADEAAEVESVSITREDVIKAFDTFASTFEDDEFSFPVEERRTALMKASKAWLAWMDARSKVSEMLKGSAKEAYNLATARIYTHQLVTLKNEFFVMSGIPFEGGRLLFNQSSTD